MSRSLRSGGNLTPPVSSEETLLRNTAPLFLTDIENLPATSVSSADPSQDYVPFTVMESALAAAGQSDAERIPPLEASNSFDELRYDLVPVLSTGPFNGSADHAAVNPADPATLLATLPAGHEDSPIDFAPAAQSLAPSSAVGSIVDIASPAALTTQDALPAEFDPATILVEQPLWLPDEPGTSEPPQAPPNSEGYPIEIYIPRDNEPPFEIPPGTVLKVGRFLRGDEGNNVLDGSGDDFSALNGGAGNDVLTGGTGLDSFIFRSDETGSDRIIDFEDGVDRITFYTSSSAPLTFADLRIEDGPDGAIITYGESSILLEGQSAANLAADDFGFVEVPEYPRLPEEPNPPPPDGPILDPRLGEIQIPAWSGSSDPIDDGQPLSENTRIINIPQLESIATAAPDHHSCQESFQPII